MSWGVTRPGVTERKLEASPQRPKHVAADVPGVDQGIATGAEHRFALSLAPYRCEHEQDPGSDGCRLRCQSRLSLETRSIDYRPGSVGRPLESQDSRRSALEYQCAQTGAGKPTHESTGEQAPSPSGSRSQPQRKGDEQR